MEISFYVLLVLACMVLVLAMWACAASSTTKWGPDLTLELPPHLLQEALFPNSVKPQKFNFSHDSVPSAPSELPCDPLLANEQPMGISSPPRKHYWPVMDTAVRVLPTHCVPKHKTKVVFSTFSTEEPA